MTNPEVELTRAQKLIYYMTGDLGLKLPIEDDSLVPAASEMAPGVGMSVRDTAETMSYLRKRKPQLLPNPRPENTRRRSTVSVSLSRGGKGLALERYAFMTGEEAYLTLLQKLGEEEVNEMGLDEKSAGRIVTKHRIKMGTKRTDEEKKVGHQAVHEPKEVKRGRVKFWSQVMDSLDQQGIKRPDNRLIWMDIWQRAEDVNSGVGLVIERLQEGQRLHSVIQQILEKANVQSVDELSPVTQFDAPKPIQLDSSQLELPTLESVINPKVVKIIKGAKLDTIPASLEDWTTLVEFLEAKEESFNGNPEKYKKFVERINEIPEYLTPCFRAITEHLANHRSRI